MKRTRLLLAEDDEVLAEVLAEYLEEADYDVMICQRGDHALEALKKEDFDLVLTDIVMPGADGLTLLRYISEQRDDARHNSDTLVILMTGYSGIEDALHAVEKGAYDFVSKPFQLPEILVRLNNAARYQRLLRRYQSLIAKSGRRFPLAEIDIKPPPGSAAARAYHQSGGEERAGRR